MKDLTREEKLVSILQFVHEFNITAYEISKNTDLTAAGISRIINGKIKNPLNSTVNTIYDFIQTKYIQEKNQNINDRGLLVSKSKNVPFYNIEFSGSQVKSLEELEDYVSFYVDYEPLNDCTAFVPYYGESMLPKYKSGDALGVKQIKNFDALLWGESHLVITNDNANNIKTVKNVHQHKDFDKVILRAINPDYAGDTVIEKTDILSMFLVKGKVELNQL
ncbi:hypothetical protein ASG38_15140 [Flavobacterium sp. Leaf359]|uniref:S24 family peptidase n=1 Tax=Flavobacterium sp. Leaf359 TaxID=1736351 RepID=UPI0006F58C4B|nr:S24 family peptidase [Flavobacterium sp. Leaf359]KQS45942.1 hypothetical protein ASG38_15140 [Flavobacterium sp. Leaf359]